MKIFTVIFAFIIIGFTFHPNPAQTSEQLVIETSKRLIEKPFDRETLEMRKSVMEWVNQNREFRLSCSLSGHYLPDSYQFRGDLFAAFIIGTVAFHLENPNKSEDNSKNAGLISMVKTYEQMIKIKPEAKLKKLDQLLAEYKNSTNLVRLFNCSFH